MNHFSGFYRPNEKEFKELWDTCVFVLDTNVILNLYRYPEVARNTLLKLIEEISHKVWLPHQVALEYHFNVLDEIKRQEKAYDQLKAYIEKSYLNIESEYKKYSLRHTNLKLDEQLTNELKRAVENLSNDLELQQKEHPDLYDLQLRVNTLFDNSIGDPFLEEELKCIYDDGIKRYKLERPPGYKDHKNKEGLYYIHDGIKYMREYGDLVLWKQIIKYANDKKSSIVFITEDNKEDWFQKYDGKTLGPQPELIQEFKRETGLQIYMYKTKQFLNYAPKSLKVNISEEEISKAIESIDAYKKQSEQSIDIENEKIEQMEGTYTELKEQGIYELLHSNQNIFNDYELLHSNKNISSDIEFLKKKIIKDHRRTLKNTREKTYIASLFFQKHRADRRISLEGITEDLSMVLDDLPEIREYKISRLNLEDFSLTVKFKVIDINNENINEFILEKLTFQMKRLGYFIDDISEVVQLERPN